jgi:hypothetical protein
MPEFSLLGGPLQWLGCRLGLVRQGTNTVRMGVALGLFTWGVLSLLRLLEGSGSRLFALVVIGAPIRLLVAIPLFFLCETWVGLQMAEFSRYAVRSRLVRETSLPKLASDIRLVGRLNDSWLAELLFLVAALVLPLVELTAIVPGSTASWVLTMHLSGGRLSWADCWYLGFCLPLFRFLIFRWLWRLSLWWYFLWRLEKLELRLMPTHSDGAAGLGYLNVVHEAFGPLILAISAVCSAGFAEDISSGAMTFDSLYSSIPVVLLLNAALFIGPLFIFTRKLYICRWTGLSEYMAMASRYVNAFDSKWIRDEQATGESQLGTADLQSLADLTNSVNVVRGMHAVPFSRRLVVDHAVCVIVPLLPLVFLKYPISQVAAQLFHSLSGL